MITASMTGTFEDENLTFNVSGNAQNDFTAYTFSPKNGERYHPVSDINQLGCYNAFFCTVIKFNDNGTGRITAKLSV
jgi:hypothetical protein